MALSSSASQALHWSRNLTAPAEPGLSALVPGSGSALAVAPTTGGAAEVAASDTEGTSPGPGSQATRKTVKSRVSSDLGAAGIGNSRRRLTRIEGKIPWQVNSWLAMAAAPNPGCLAPQRVDDI